MGFITIMADYLGEYVGFFPSIEQISSNSKSSLKDPLLQCLGSTQIIGCVGHDKLSFGSFSPSKIKQDLTNGPLGKVQELLDTQV